MPDSRDVARLTPRLLPLSLFARRPLSSVELAALEEVESLAFPSCSFSVCRGASSFPSMTLSRRRLLPSGVMRPCDGLNELDDRLGEMGSSTGESWAELSSIEEQVFEGEGGSIPCETSEWS